jgi:hypothetical protein
VMPQPDTATVSINNRGNKRIKGFLTKAYIKPAWRIASR